MVRFLPSVENRLNDFGWELGPAGSGYEGSWCALSEGGKIITDQTHFLVFRKVFLQAEQDAKSAGEFNLRRPLTVRSDKPDANGLMPPKVI